MRRRSFFLSLLVGNLILVVVVVLLGGTIADQFLTDSYQQSQKATQLSMARLSQQYVESLWPTYGDKPDALDRYCKEHLRPGMGASRLTIIATDGTVLGESSEVRAVDMVPHRTPDRPEVAAALTGGTGWDERASETLGVPFRYIALPVRRDGNIVACVRVATPLEDLVEARAFILRSLAIAAGAAGLAAVLLALLLSWVFANSPAAPVPSPRASSTGKCGFADRPSWRTWLPPSTRCGRASPGNWA